MTTPVDLQPLFNALLSAYQTNPSGYPTVAPSQEDPRWQDELRRQMDPKRQLWHQVATGLHAAAGALQRTPGNAFVGVGAGLHEGVGAFEDAQTTSDQQRLQQLSALDQKAVQDREQKIKELAGIFTTGAAVNTDARSAESTQSGIDRDKAYIEYLHGKDGGAGGMTPDQVADTWTKIQDATARWAHDNYVTDPAAVQAEEHRRAVQAGLVKEDPNQPQPAPTVVRPPPKSTIAPGAEGSPQNPFRPMTAQEVDRLPDQSSYINPATGETLTRDYRTKPPGGIPTTTQPVPLQNTPPPDDGGDIVPTDPNDSYNPG